MSSGNMFVKNSSCKWLDFCRIHNVSDCKSCSWKKKHTHIEIYYGKMVFVFRFENHFSLYIVYTTQWEVLE